LNTSRVKIRVFRYLYTVSTGKAWLSHQSQAVTTSGLMS